MAVGWTWSVEPEVDAVTPALHGHLAVSVDGFWNWYVTLGTRCLARYEWLRDLARHTMMINHRVSWRRWSKGSKQRLVSSDATTVLRFLARAEMETIVCNWVAVPDSSLCDSLACWSRMSLTERLVYRMFTIKHDTVQSVLMDYAKERTKKKKSVMKVVVFWIFKVD